EGPCILPGKFFLTKTKMRNKNMTSGKYPEAMFLYFCMDFLKLFPDGKKVRKGIRAFCYIPQQSGRVVNCCHPGTVTQPPFPMLPGNAEFGVDDSLRRNTTQANNNLGLYQCHLIP